MIPSCGRRERAVAVPGQSAERCAKCTTSGTATGGPGAASRRRERRSQ